MIEEASSNNFTPVFDFEKFKTETVTEEKPTEITEGPKEENTEHEGGESTQTAEQQTEALRQGLSAIKSDSVVALFDIVMSRIGSGLSNLAGYKSTYKDYKLDVDEKKFLIPFCDTVVMDFIKKLKPEHVLIFALILMYGAKFMIVMDNKEPEKKEGKKKESTETIEEKRIRWALEKKEKTNAKK